MSEHLYNHNEVARRQHLAECKECQQIAYEGECQRDAVVYGILCLVFFIAVAVILRKQLGISQ